MSAFATNNTCFSYSQASQIQCKRLIAIHTAHSSIDALWRHSIVKESKHQSKSTRGFQPIEDDLVSLQYACSIDQARDSSFFGLSVLRIYTSIWYEMCSSHCQLRYFFTSNLLLFDKSVLSCLRENAKYLKIKAIRTLLSWKYKFMSALATNNTCFSYSLASQIQCKRLIAIHTVHSSIDALWRHSIVKQSKHQSKSTRGFHPIEDDLVSLQYACSIDQARDTSFFGLSVLRIYTSIWYEMCSSHCQLR